MKHTMLGWGHAGRGVMCSCGEAFYGTKYTGHGAMQEFESHRDAQARDETLRAADDICRLAGLDPRNVKKWGEVKGAILALVDRT